MVPTKASAGMCAGEPIALTFPAPPPFTHRETPAEGCFGPKYSGSDCVCGLRGSPGEELRGVQGE